jgi:hypothetical protein
VFSGLREIITRTGLLDSPDGRRHRWVIAAIREKYRGFGLNM